MDFVNGLESRTLLAQPNAWEFWYQFQITDNIFVTPALFYLSRPLGTATQGESFNEFGGLVKTSFRF